MLKSYEDCMNEISSEELYEGLLSYGMFMDKLPPVLSSVGFYNYCQNNEITEKGKRQCIYYESMRNNNTPRSMGIPNPMAYQRLCECLSSNWDSLKLHFKEQTNEHEYKISRIHIRKQEKGKTLFAMNYSNWRVDGAPEPSLLIGMKFLVKADISTCFPSIYTHSIPWALVGKETAKEHSGIKHGNLWYNEIDFYTRNCKNGETHGLLIGPHASNLLSEIILTVVDKKLYDKGFRFIRNIDDYECYVESHEQGLVFLSELAGELRRFDLSLNHKKTEIKELPVAAEEQWVRKLNLINIFYQNGKLDFIGTRAYLDFAVELMQENKRNSAVLKYAIKVLSSQTLTANAKDYYIKTILHLSLLYPYLIPMLDRYVFDVFCIEEELVASFLRRAFNLGITCRNYEAVCFIIYFALKFNLEIPDLCSALAIESDSCMFKLLAFLFFSKTNRKNDVKEMIKHAKSLKNDDDFDRNWLFAYEALPMSYLKGDWEKMKRAGVSFVNFQPSYR